MHSPMPADSSRATAPDPRSPRPWARPDDAPSPVAPRAHAATFDLAGRVARRDKAANGLADLCAPRARTVIEALDAGFELVRRRPRTMLLLALPFVVPVDLLAAYLERGAGTGADGSLLDGGGAVFGSGGGSAAGVVLGLVLRSLSLVLIAAAVAQVIAAAVNDVERAPADALRATVRRAPALVVAWGLVHLLEAAGLVGAGVGAVVVMSLLLVTVPALIVENIGPVAAVRRSVRLTRPQLGRALGFGLLSAFTVGVVGLIANIVPLAIAGLVGFAAAWPIVAAGGIVSSMLLLPVLAAATTFFYLDLRVRREGLDLELDAIEHFGPVDA